MAKQTGFRSELRASELGCPATLSKSGKSGKSNANMNPIDFNGLDTAIHGPLRLGIMAALQVDGALDFTTLKKRLNTVDGSLNLHLGKLEKRNYITSKKAFVGLRPKTTYKITPAGRKALAEYIQSMKNLIKHLEASA
jgi:DNA-binding MarR family transcriptional regulator